MALVDNSTVIRKSDPDEHERRIGLLRTALESGAFPSTAASYAGLSPSTLAKWVEEGGRLRQILEAVRSDPEDDREPSPNELELMWLSEQMEQAEAAAEQGLVSQVHRAAETEWRAALALLERRWKDRWAKRSEVTGADGGALQVEDLAAQRQMVADALAKVNERISRAEGALEDGQGAEVVGIEREGRSRRGQFEVDDDEEGSSGSSSA